MSIVLFLTIDVSLPPTVCVCNRRVFGYRIGLDHALASPMVQRWSSLAGWDRNKLVCLWDGDGPAGSVKDLDGFKVQTM